jgi:hypothetical protein
MVDDHLLTLSAVRITPNQQGYPCRQNFYEMADWCMSWLQKCQDIAMLRIVRMLCMLITEWMQSRARRTFFHDCIDSHRRSIDR